MQQLQKGSTLQGGKYVIEEVLGQGGFGITYAATHSILENKVAIKEFFPRDYCAREEATCQVSLYNPNNTEIALKLKDKFIKEAKNIFKLRHPNIVSIYDVFEENGTAYYVMEYIEGLSLLEIVKTQGRLSESDSLGYMVKIAAAVGYMHSLHMNHLDLKPANIMIRNADKEPIVIDFGLSKQYDASGGQTSTTPVGISHGFAPIEQYKPGGVSTFTPQTDIYALGATLYNLLTGKVPPHYSELLEEGFPAMPSEVSEKVTRVVEHSMEVRKNKRPSSISEFLDELSPVKSSAISAATESVDVSSQRKKSTKNNAKDIVEESSEETVLIGDVKSGKKSKASDGMVDIDGVEFVDLGLSVKWANKNVGADSERMIGMVYSKDMLETFPEKDKAMLPTVEDFDELRMKCRWRKRIVERSTIGYDIIGPNGNAIYLPIKRNVSVALLMRPTPVCNPLIILNSKGISVSTSTVYPDIHIRKIKK